MSFDWEVIGAGVAIALLIVFVRILVPVLWSVFQRAVAHGPIAIGAPNSGGRWLGWVGTAFWSLFESKREEKYEYLRLTRVERWHEGTAQEAEIRGIPVRVSAETPQPDAPGHDLMSRDYQQLTPDGQYWWTGREWVSTQRFVPPSAPRSVDGSHWWDGSDWRWVPNEFPASKWSTPWRAVTRERTPATTESWFIARRGHTNSVWRTRDAVRPPERSDPPPDFLQPGGGTRKRRRRR